jgi:hypoxanthine-DNA glycosylase
VCGQPFPETREEKIAFALEQGIAIWDVLAGCEIKGADDSSIRNPRPNNLRRILEVAEIRAIFATGTKAAQLYQRYCYPVTGREIITLPSTSPANCRVTYEKLYEAYAVIKNYM